LGLQEPLPGVWILHVCILLINIVTFLCVSLADKRSIISVRTGLFNVILSPSSWPLSASTYGVLVELSYPCMLSSWHLCV
jgi:hypothetical protein